MLQVDDDFSVVLLVLVQQVDRLYSIESEFAEVVSVHHAHLVRLRLVTAPHLRWHLEVCLVSLVSFELTT